ncbi:Microtubule-associated serine/threonine-protein kinase 2 [Wickerhamomyces ciferrii]|uniref:Microtubule-associated serine/threonine-protein kinase 2 n=1 Tax=Wickerhamomyces ciferrii (strain ATCC 14091 / BCRC 22168 / CBS 111 / JCM 3599 / NBRC 0793 / NRRL Y-1031 F-60-10) TaxID=1206466 RepID=K0KG25_WICCF|nr:Microtubule-associated serine/threonine-protein kinase 2 [Wickerhamomyces ciferrii]CCH41157.1 Microtubule-associated serine/threonine-protein kinase 2 [Wickerhamomyces ciferrii]
MSQNNQMLAEYVESAETRRNRIKELCKDHRNEVLSLTFEMIKEANGAILSHSANEDRIHLKEIKEIGKLFKVPDSIIENTNSDTISYEESILNDLHWFVLAMTKPQIRLNPLMDPKNVYLYKLIDQVFTKDSDRAMCISNRIIKSAMNPSQSTRLNTLMRHHKDIVISKCEEISLEFIENECIKVADILYNAEKNLVKIDDMFQLYLWNHGMHKQELDIIEMNKNIIERELNSEQFKLSNRKDKVLKLSNLIQSRLGAPIKEDTDVTNKMFYLCTNINWVMSRLDNTFENLEITLETPTSGLNQSTSVGRDRSEIRSNASSNNSSEVIRFNTGPTAIDIIIKSQFTGNGVLFECKRTKYLRQHFRRFISSNTNDQLNSQENQLMGNMLKQMITYCSELNLNTCVLTNWSTIIVIEIDLNQSSPATIDGKEVIDLINSKYRMVDFDDQGLTFNWIIVYLLKHVHKEIDLKEKTKMMEQFLLKFYRTPDHQEIQKEINKKRTHSGRSEDSNVQRNSDHKESRQELEEISSDISTLFPNGISQYVIQGGEGYTSQVFEVYLEDLIKMKLHFESMTDVSPGKKYILKVYNLNPYEFYEEDANIKYQFFNQEVKSLKMIKTHNQYCTSTQNHNSIINTADLYKYFILQLNNSKGEVVLYGYGLLLEYIEKAESTISLNKELIEADYNRQLDILEEIGIIHNDLQNTQNIIITKNSKVYFIDWGLSKIIEKKMINSADSDTLSIDSYSKSGLFTANVGITSSKYSNADDLYTSGNSAIADKHQYDNSKYSKQDEE